MVAIAESNMEPGVIGLARPLISRDNESSVNSAGVAKNRTANGRISVRVGGGGGARISVGHAAE